MTLMLANQLKGISLPRESRGINQWYTTCIFWSRILKSSVDRHIDYEVNYFTMVYKPYLGLTINCIWFDNVWMCIFEAIPDYVISSTHTSNLVLLGNITPLSSSLLVLIQGSIKENAHSGTCLIRGHHKFGVRGRSIFFDGRWSMERRDWRVRKFISEGYCDVVGDLWH